MSSPRALRSIYRGLLPREARRYVAELGQRSRHLPGRADSRFRQSLARLAQLRNAHAGKACVVIGNGPSMRDFDLGRLAGLSTFCLNRGYLMWQEQGLSPDFLVAVNDLVIEQFADELQRVGRLRFVPWLKRQHFRVSDPDLVFFEERWDRAFATDARRGLGSLGTVTNAALQLALHMGFATVAVIGVDHHFAQAAQGAPNEMVVQQHGDVDHFRPDYFAPGTRWHLPDLDLSEVGYVLARRAFERAGRRIVNAGWHSRLEIFERVELSAILPVLRSQAGKPAG